MKRAIVTVGLGWGDEGKGATVDYLCRHFNADLVIRYCGGSQCSHNVKLPDNKGEHTFAQFGAGTIAGAKTYIGPQVVIFPEALRKEARNLEKYVSNPMERILIHPRCLVTTRFHRAANQIREIARGKERHGSCGHGIGEARRYWLNYGRDAIFAEDLKNFSVLTEKLELLRQRLLMDLQSVFPATKTAAEGIFDIPTIEIASVLDESSDLFGLTSRIPNCETAVFEGAQGILLDEYEGFHPHTTWSTVTARFAQELITQAGAGLVLNVGVTRAYTTRHGAGPFPTESKELTEIVNDKGNPWNEWQESFRAGWLDLNLLHYAASVAGCKLDCIAVNCLDHVMFGGKIATLEKDLLRPNNKRLSESERQNELLNASVNTGHLKPVLRDAAIEQILEEIEKVAPVALTANGPSHQDRTLTEWGKKNLR